MLWHHLLTRDIIEACQDTVRHGWEADALLEANGVEARLHVAEVLARAGAPHGLNLSPVDAILLSSLRYYTLDSAQWSGGTILRTPAGHAAYALGDGRVVESTGKTLTIVREPGSRYVAGYRIPITTHHH